MGLPSASRSRASALRSNLSGNARLGSDARGRRAGAGRQPGDHPEAWRAVWRHQSRRRAGVGHARNHADRTNRTWRGSRAEDAAGRAIVIRRRRRCRPIGARCADRNARELMPHHRGANTEACEQRLQRQRIGGDQRDPCPAYPRSMHHDANRRGPDRAVGPNVTRVGPLRGRGLQDLPHRPPEFVAPSRPRSRALCFGRVILSVGLVALTEPGG